MMSTECKIGQPAWQCAAEIPLRVHLVGIGGIGMSAIAHVLATWGHTVTGSDTGANALTQALNRQGICTYVGHAAEQIGEADWVAASSAVPATNVELEAARRRGIPVLKRQQLLGHMMAGRVGIGVAGTHGKTTTTAIIAAMLTEAGCDPTYIVGGVLQQTGSNARAGHGPHFLVEADEYDRMFLGLRPRIAVLTHLEMDHPDCYPTMDEMRRAYVQFLRLVPAEGCIVACSDSAEVERVLAMLPDVGRPRIVRYGLASTADYVVGVPTANASGGVDFTLTGVAGLSGAYHTRIPGVHNALNAAAALIVAHEAGVKPRAAAESLARFNGVRRRFEVLGERAGVLVVDDYAHHPTEIRATLAAALLRYPERRLVAVWQPHTYSRIRTLLDEFASCFADADQVVVTDVYAARASEAEPIDARSLCDVLLHAQVRYAGGIDATVADLLAGVQWGDVVLVLGAGDSALIGERLLEKLAQREAAVPAGDQRDG
jgi:UDP-N-acetylmuramate--alanine ligase